MPNMHRKIFLTKKIYWFSVKKKLQAIWATPRPGGWVPVPVPVSLVGLSQCPQHTTYFKLYYLSSKLSIS